MRQLSQQVADEQDFTAPAPEVRAVCCLLLIAAHTHDRCAKRLGLPCFMFWPLGLRYSGRPGGLHACLQPVARCDLACAHVALHCHFVPVAGLFNRQKCYLKPISSIMFTHHVSYMHVCWPSHPQHVCCATPAASFSIS